MNHKLLDKYVTNSFSPSRVEEFLKWLTKKSSELYVKSLLFDHWKKIKEDNIDPELEKNQLEKIHHKIILRNNEFFAERNKKALRIRIVSNAAALIFIPFLTIFIYSRYFQSDTSDNIFHKTVMNEIVTPSGSRISIDLSDGTKVWLNHGSKLIYPQHFSKNTRTVKLVGEGYFDIYPMPGVPFEVETDDLKIIATGTEFNVKSYSTDNNTSTTLKSGKISVRSNSDQIYELLPGQHFSWNRNEKGAEVLDVDVEKYICWKDGKLVFHDDPFEAIADVLSRWYNVDFEIMDPEIKNLTYTATFIDEPLYQILEMLEVVTPIRCKVSDRHKLPDGTYSKKKVYVSYKRD